MWKILNKLFDWDYVAVTGIFKGVYRVRTLPSGVVVYEGSAYTPIENWAEVLWLTCTPEKYGFVRRRMLDIQNPITSEHAVCKYIPGTSSIMDVAVEWFESRYPGQFRKTS